MDRRRFLLTSLAGALAAPLAAEAQHPGKIYRIGILGDKAADSNEILAWQTFRDVYGSTAGRRVRTFESSPGGLRATSLDCLKWRLTWSGSSRI